MTKKVNVYKIDSDVPMPVEQATISEKFPLEQLEVGESFEFPFTSRRYVQSMASTIKRRKGMEYTVRKVTDDACRVWRTA